MKQASNAYRMSLPDRARQLLGRWGMTPPVPDDRVQAEAERAASIEAHRTSLDIEARTLFDVGDNPLGQALARLGKAINLRESARQTESLSGSIK